MFTDVLTDVLTGRVLVYGPITEDFVYVINSKRTGPVRVVGPVVHGNFAPTANITACGTKNLYKTCM